MRSSVLDRLRERLHVLDGGARPGKVLPFGDGRLDGCFPGGGLPLGTLHEICPEGLDGETGAAGAAFALPLVARLAAEGPVFWILQRDDLHGPGAAAFGLGPDRLILVRVEKDAEALAALEDALNCDAVAAAVAEIGRLGLTAGRRLKLACERSGATAFVLHRWPYGRPRRLAGQREPSAAASRWRVRTAPSAADGPGLGEPRWQVALEHSRGGREGAWIMEAGDATRPLRVVAELAAGAAEAATARTRAAG
ncbi:MAG TPA: damage-inducible mutagenesis protein [Hyphomicrobiales bacterium]|nr:damage-inducible mutagenesis protein [Hyphomicrobiales bacterium]